MEVKWIWTQPWFLHISLLSYYFTLPIVPSCDGFHVMASMWWPVGYTKCDEISKYLLQFCIFEPFVFHALKGARVPCFTSDSQLQTSFCVTKYGHSVWRPECCQSSTITSLSTTPVYWLVCQICHCRSSLLTCCEGVFPSVQEYVTQSCTWVDQTNRQSCNVAQTSPLPEKER